MAEPSLASTCRPPLGELDRFPVHSPAQAPKICTRLWISQPFLVFPLACSGCVGKHCCQWCKSDTFAHEIVREQLTPGCLVGVEQLGFKYCIGADRAAKMLEQVFPAEKRMSDVGFGPIEEDAPIRGNNDVPRI